MTAIYLVKLVALRKFTSLLVVYSVIQADVVDGSRHSTVK